MSKISSTIMHVACAADENYAPHCAAMLHSLLAHNPPAEVTVHFLHGPRLARNVLRNLEMVVNGCGARINFIEIPDEKVTGLQKRGQAAGVMWYRIFLPEQLPKLDRILYLDVDTLVLDSLKPLWETELGDGDYAAAVCNDFEPSLNHRPRELGLRQSTDYFNSGVLLMNLDRMRREDCTKKIIETARKYGDSLMWQDQDPLNMVFDGHWHKLHPRWNCQNSLFYFSHAKELFGQAVVREACLKPGIVHFEGPDILKPWHFLNKHPYRRQYLEHRAKTPWAAFEPMGRSIKNWFLRPLPFMVILAVSDFEYRVKLKLKRLFSMMKLRHAST